jgi:CheY-like chemotaxis protein
MSKPLVNPSAVTVRGRKRILLLATYATKRDLRAKILRKMGIEVDCAADIAEARLLWQADAYNLLLVDVRNDSQNLRAFCDEVRGAKPPQTVAFLVGKPVYLAGSPSPDDGVAVSVEGERGPWAEMVLALYGNACGALPRRWGFIEASWRIRATRSLKDPRRQKTAVEAEAPRWSWANAIHHHSEELAG